MVGVVALGGVEGIARTGLLVKNDLNSRSTLVAVTSTFYPMTGNETAVKNMKSKCEKGRVLMDRAAFTHFDLAGYRYVRVGLRKTNLRRDALELE